jgi:alpha-ketoglutarate-dependent taurine dioxygenase
MKIRPVANVGVEIVEVDVTCLTKSEFEEIRQVFLSELLVVIRNQPVLTLPFAKIVASIGPIANMGQCWWNRHGEKISTTKADPFTWQGGDESFPVQRVTGMKKGGEDSGIFGSGKLDWHSNMNGHFNRAPGVALQGIEGVVGTSTSWMDTTKAYEDLSSELKIRCQSVTGRFEYSPEIWAEGLPSWQYEGMVQSKEPFYEMPLVNTSRKGKKGLYFHYLNKCHFPSDPDLLNILKDHCFKDKYIQTIEWQPGDIHLSDQVLTLHKRNQDGEDILSKRVLHRYTFQFDNIIRS